MTTPRDNTTQRATKLVELYRQGASRHGRASDEGRSARMINRGYHQLARALRQLHELDADWHQAMLPLLDDKDCHVRLWAATDLHEVEPERTRAVMEDIAANASSAMARFNAQIMLEKWDGKWS